MAKTIYAVSSGSYSDYRVNALFSAREKAQEFIDALTKPNSYNDFNDIEEYELDSDTADMIRRGYAIWYVQMQVDGTVDRVERTSTDLFHVGEAGHRVWERSKAPAYKGQGIPNLLNSNVWAKTEKAAVKIVNEKRLQMIASGELTTGLDAK